MKEAGNVQLPRFYAYLWKDEEREVHGASENHPQEIASKAEGGLY
jgi:hypothetical protein